jgi:hypothetical protein
MEKVCKAN